MLAATLVLTLLSADEDGGITEADELPPVVEDAGVPRHFDRGPLPNDGRVIDFFPSDAGPPRLEPRWLHLKGNRVLPEEVYRNSLNLLSDAKPDADTAQYIEETIYDFLIKSGYELATVGAVLRDDEVDVQIDEGQLEKVVFAGKLTAKTLRFRLELAINHDVFNRPALERHVAELSERVGLPVVKYSLVPTANPVHYGPQLENVPAIEGVELFRSRKRYELRFYFEENEWGSGLGLDLRSGYIDGLELGLNYQGVGLFGDRWRVASSGGVGARFRITDRTIYPAFSRAFAEARWYSPKLGRLRPGVWVTGNLFARQRPDLYVENYNEASVIASFHVAIDVLQGLHVVPTVGAQWRRVFNINTATAVIPPNIDKDLIPTESERIRFFFELFTEWVFDPDNERSDRQHWVELGARYYFGRSTDPNANGYLSYGWVYEHYRKVFEFGWHDLWIKSNARFAFGDVQFHDELNLGELLRGVFGGNFVRKGGNASVEFRFSLSRDVLKLSLFTEVAAWGDLFDRPRSDANGVLIDPPVEALAFGVCGGPGVHALIQGMFQMDIYAVFGARRIIPGANPPETPFSFGVVAWLNKVF